MQNGEFTKHIQLVKIYNIVVVHLPVCLNRDCSLITFNTAGKEPVSKNCCTINVNGLEFCISIIKQYTGYAILARIYFTFQVINNVSYHILCCN